MKFKALMEDEMKQLLLAVMTLALMSSAALASKLDFFVPF
jgi:hypothetical protein